jgi:hypothetical protein
MKITHCGYFLFLFFIFGLFLLSPGCKDESTNPITNKTPVYFPLSLGNTWTYAPADTFYGLPFEWEVTERQGDTATLVRPVRPGHSGTIRLLENENNIDIILNNQNLPNYRFKESEMWVHRDNWECDDSASYIVIKETDTIITPAGKFTDCLRIERRSSIPCLDAGTIVEWWAPNVGLVRWDEMNFYVGGPLIIYLVDYNVNK